MSENNSIAKLFTETSSKYAENFAIGFFENQKLNHIKFKKYKEIIEYLSLGLTSLGQEAHSKLCILSSTRKEWHFIDMATLLTNGVSVPIYPSYTAEEVLYILNHCEAKFLIIENHDISTFNG